MFITNNFKEQPAVQMEPTGRNLLARWLHFPKSILIFQVHYLVHHSTGRGQDQPPPLFRAGPKQTGNFLDVSLYLFVSRIKDSIKGDAKGFYQCRQDFKRWIYISIFS